MKRFGIVSYNIHCNFTNYGSALQSWALCRAIEGTKLAKPVLIDYCPDILKDKDPLNPMKNMWDSDSEYKRQCELSLPAIRENYKKFEKFYTDRFERTKTVYYKENFDTAVKNENLDGFVCGSDTIFCIDEFGFDGGYYAEYPSMKNSYTVAYAASFGDSHFNSESYKELNRRLQNFKAIALREENMVSYVKRHTDVPCTRVVDPTLLLTAKDYDTIAEKRLEDSPYLLLYARRYNPEMEKCAEKIAKEKNLKIIEISLYAENAKKHKMFYEAGVEEFLSLVKYADYVVTNSFHGAIFSVQYGRPFSVFSREQCDNKIEELMSLFGLKDRVVTSGDFVSDEEIDYTAVHKRIEKNAKCSLEFLKAELSGDFSGVDKRGFYPESYDKSDCFACSACKQACPKSAIELRRDTDGFWYPYTDAAKCVDCGICKKVCPNVNMPERFSENKFAFGGSNKSGEVLESSTSGGAFSAIADSWCDKNYVIFGAVSKALSVYHEGITDKKELCKFRKSKYSQSDIKDSYIKAKEALTDGKKVLFSGTPCQIAGLLSFLNGKTYDKLLTVEVVCEGVPSPLYIEKYGEWIRDKYGAPVKSLDYRYKNRNKWDFEAMQTVLENGKVLKKDRWFNPFWKIWLDHLMSRPSCYKCPFANDSRVADITLGDLWGVHIYCPDLYEKNKGASLVVCNTEKGKEAFSLAKPYMNGRELKFEDALKYQSPMRKPISDNKNRAEFADDLKTLSYKQLIKKWYKGPTLKLLWQKYVYGNRQKVWLYNAFSKKTKVSKEKTK